MGKIIKLGKVGDIKLSWSTDNAEEIKAANTMFNEKVNEGWVAFADKGKGTRGDKIKLFDANAERIILVPHLVAG